MLRYVPGSGGAGGAARRRSPRPRPSSAASRAGCTTSACRRRRRWRWCGMLDEAELVERSRIIMEKPFGTDLASAPGAQRRAARDLRRGADLPHRPLPRQGGGAEHPRLPVRQRAVRADLEPQPHRPRADRRARDAGARARAPGSTRRPAPTATWSSPTCSRCWRSWRWSRRPRWSRGRSARRRTRSSARCCRSSRPTSCAGQYVGYRDEPGVAPDSETETFIALRVRDRQLALGRRAVLPAHRQAAWPRARASSRSRSGSRRRACSRPAPGVGAARARPPHVRPRRRVEAVAVVLRQAARARA